jgi:hypothetical protein
MRKVTLTLTAQEWIKLRDAAAKQFPNEVLSRGEMLRRYAMIGIAALKPASDADQKRRAHEFRSSQHVASPEGDKPRTSW